MSMRFGVLRFKIDEPEKFSGSTEALTPMEYIILSLNGCFMIVVGMVAKEKELTIEKLNDSSSGAIDGRGFFGTAEVSPHWGFRIKSAIMISSEAIRVKSSLRTT